MRRFKNKTTTVKNKPPSFKELQRKLSTDTDEDKVDSNLEYLKRKHKGLLLLLFLIPNVIVFVYPYVMSKAYPGTVPVGNSVPQTDDFLPHVPLEAHQRYSLLEQYNVNYTQVMQIREANMRKYTYEYNKFGIDRRTNLSYQEYVDVYDGKWPVIITDIVPKWKAMGKWTRDFFYTYYGKDRIAMKAVDGSLENAVGLALPLELFYQNTDKAFPHQWTYLEDELFVANRPELMQDIGDYVYLRNDLFQLFPDAIRPWSAMLLWGTAYSRSSLHIDPYNWTGTNAVLSGTKRWRLYPPGQDKYLSVFENRKSGYPLDCYKYNSPVDAYDPQTERFPQFSKATAIEFEQKPGELLLLPTGWFHQAYNLEETIAISSQMMNHNNYRIVLEEIFKAGAIKRNQLPDNIDSLTPKEQVKLVMDMVPADIIERGHAITKNINDQVENVDKSKKLAPPPERP